MCPCGPRSQYFPAGRPCAAGNAPRAASKCARIHAFVNHDVGGGGHAKHLGLVFAGVVAAVADQQDYSLVVLILF